MHRRKKGRFLVYSLALLCVPVTGLAFAQSTATATYKSTAPDAAAMTTERLPAPATVLPAATKTSSKASTAPTAPAAVAPSVTSPTQAVVAAEPTPADCTNTSCEHQAPPAKPPVSEIKPEPTPVACTNSWPTQTCFYDDGTITTGP